MSSPLVLVHGNPESSAIWRPLLATLTRDAVPLSPPGFGAPIPHGFDCTPRAYRDWLTSSLESLGEPVDLVGHDLGGAAVLGVAMTRPDLVRTWASDSIGVLHPDYVWHDLARTWQTPGRGEALVEEVLGGDLADRSQRLVEYGLPPDVAADVAAVQDEAMRRAVLAFYRSAAQPVMADLGQGLEGAARRRGLVVIGADDDLVGTSAMARESAARAGADVLEIDGAGHLWMVQRPERVARALEAHWHRADTAGTRATPQQET